MASFDNQLQEQFGFAYVRAIISHAGFTMEGSGTDIYSNDFTIYGRVDHILTMINIQMKTKLISEKMDFSKPHFSYPLPRKNYTDMLPIQGTYRRVPHLLVVLLLPNKEERLMHTTEKMELRQCAYWVDLFGLPNDLEPEQVHKTVHVPFKNVFSPHQLKKLMTLACNTPNERLSLND